MIPFRLTSNDPSFRKLLSKLLVEEVSQALVDVLEVLEVTLVTQVSPSSGPTVVAVRVVLVHAVLGERLLLHRSLESIDVLLRLVLRGEVGNGNGQLLGISGVDHSRVNLSNRSELGTFTTGDHAHLSTPAEPDQTELGSTVLLELVSDGFEIGLACAKVAGFAEELLESLLLLIGVGWVEGLGERFAAEKVGHDDARLGGFGEEIGTLLGSVVEAKDVVDYDDGVFGILGSNAVGVEATDLFSGALGRAFHVNKSKSTASAITRSRKQSTYRIVILTSRT